MKKKIKTAIKIKKPAKSEKKDTNIKKLINEVYDVMLEEGLQEIIWKEDNDFEIKLRRKGTDIPLHAIATSMASSHNSKSKKTIDNQEEEIDTATYIRSPMNGTFYRAPTPGAEPFVKENDDVPVGRTVCIIEAMKLMNEVQVERHCKILKVLAKNGESIKVSQPIYEIENL